MASDEKVKSLCGNCLVELRDCQWLLNMRPFPGSRYLTFRDSSVPNYAFDYYCMVKCPKHIPVPVVEAPVLPKTHGKRRRVYSEDANGCRQYYASAAEAARRVNGHHNDIIARCRGKGRTYLGLKWRYADGENVTE